jgi:endoglycosylceramidase
VRRSLVLLLALALLPAASGERASGAASSGTPKLKPRALDARTLPLGHRGRWLIDRHGRVVILRGVNMVAKLPPYDPGRFGFSEDDAAFLASEGFNTVRLGLIYKGLEPERGRYDNAYLERIARLARMLGRHGIHVLADFHQDLFNERFSGEGFPDWAVIDDGLPAEPDVGFPGNYFVMPALWRAFDHFWANDPGPDGVGLQDAYAAAWRHAATRFRREPAVFGYDILNEAWPGSPWLTCLNPAGCPVFDASLKPFYDRVIAAIRKADRTRIAFYETHPIFGGGGDVAIPDLEDPNVGFSFHVYCLGALFGGSQTGVPEQVNCPLGEDRPFERAEAQSQRTDDALLMTEFGATDDLATLTRDIEAADAHLTSWQYWSYFGLDPSGERPAEGIIIDPRKPPTRDNVKQPKLDVLVRPYPRAVAGTPTSWSFDPEARTFELRFTSNPSIRMPTEIFVPARHFPRGYSVRLTGPARVVSARNAPLLLLRGTGPGEVRVEITPR